MKRGFANPVLEMNWVKVGCVFRTALIFCICGSVCLLFFSGTCMDAGGTAIVRETQGLDLPSAAVHMGSAGGRVDGASHILSTCGWASSLVATQGCNERSFGKRVSSERSIF